jgi:hypothetical protein
MGLVSDWSCSCSSCRLHAVLTLTWPLAGNQVCFFFSHPHKRCYHGRAFVPKAPHIIVRPLGFIVPSRLSNLFQQPRRFRVRGLVPFYPPTLLRLDYASLCSRNAFKTEVMYLSQPRVNYSTADTSRFDIHNADGSAVGFVGFTKNTSA